MSDWVGSGDARVNIANASKINGTSATYISLVIALSMMCIVVQLPDETHGLASRHPFGSDNAGEMTPDQFGERSRTRCAVAAHEQWGAELGFKAMQGRAH
jgi:hypothetical protein